VILGIFLCCSMVRFLVRVCFVGLCFMVILSWCWVFLRFLCSDSCLSLISGY